MRRILLFDSDHHHASGIIEVLKTLFCPVMVCSELSDALEMLRKEQFDLLLYSADPATEWKARMEIVLWAVSQMHNPPEVLCLLCGSYRGPAERVYAAQRGFRVVMKNDDRFSRLAEEIDFLLAERKQIRAAGPHLRIIHRFWRPGTVCMAGEEVAEVCLISRCREYSLHLSSALRVLLDYLARHKHLLQSATQIAAGMSCDPFCRKHGANAGSRKGLHKVSGRTAVKQQIIRLRGALAGSLDTARVNADARRVVVSEETATNEIRYRLQASVDWQHCEH